MFKRINNWHLSVLVLVVSVFSLMLVQQQVFAQWINPTDTPGQAGNSSLILNPLVENVDLNGFKFTDDANPTFVFEPGGTTGLNITGTGYGINATGATYAGYFNGNLHITGDLTVDGSGGASSVWVSDTDGIHYDAGLVGINGPSHNGFKLAIYSDDQSDILKLNPGLVWGYGTDLELRSSGDVYSEQKIGIGTSAPNPSAGGRLMHIYDDRSTGPADVHNAEIDLQSISGNNEHWAIYHDYSTEDLKFWNGGADRVIFTDDGKVGINVNPTQKLNVYDTTDGAYPIWGELKNDLSGGAVIGLRKNSADAIKSIGVLGLKGPSHLGGATLSAGTYGASSDNGGYGVYGYSYSGAGTGVYGSSESSIGVHGVNISGLSSGVMGQGLYGVFGVPNVSTANAVGVFGLSTVNSQQAIKGVNAAAPGAGSDYTDKSLSVYGEGYWAIVGTGKQNGASTNNSIGIVGNGYTGVYGNSTVAGGIGIHGVQGTGDYAGYFEGDVALKHTAGGPYNYLQIDHLSAGATPPAIDCDGNLYKGRIIYDYTNDRLYICDDSGWKYATMN